MSERNETIADFIELRRANANALESAAGGKPNQFQRELIADLRNEADRLEAAWKRERATIENSSAVGNAAKMRDALKIVLDALKKAYATLEVDRVWLADNIDIITAALAAPPRNCDVGTAEEQINRHYRYCSCRLGDGDDPHSCGHISCSECVIRWAQMEYKEEGK